RQRRASVVTTYPPPTVHLPAARCDPETAGGGYAIRTGVPAGGRGPRVAGCAPVQRADRRPAAPVGTDRGEPRVLAAAQAPGRRPAGTGRDRPAGGRRHTDSRSDGGVARTADHLHRTRSR